MTPSAQKESEPGSSARTAAARTSALHAMIRSCLAFAVLSMLALVCSPQRAYDPPTFFARIGPGTVHPSTADHFLFESCAGATVPCDRAVLGPDSAEGLWIWVDPDLRWHVRIHGHAARRIEGAVGSAGWVVGSYDSLWSPLLVGHAARLTAPAPYRIDFQLAPGV